MPANYVLLQRQILNANTASVTFSNIPQTGYTDLKIELSTRNTSSGTGWSDLFLNVNGQGASTNITIRHLYSTGSGVGTNTGGSGSSVGNVNPNGNTANSFATTILYFPNYTTGTKKSFSSEAVSEQLSSQALTSVSAGLWNQTAAITSLSFTTDAGQSFAAGSSFSLYGIAALGTSPTSSVKASGGDIVVNDGTYWYHAFLGSGYFVPNQTFTSDVLVVAGGGGGGGDIPGGAGAGGILYKASTSVTANTSYSVLVGAGGTYGVQGQNNLGTQGNDSYFDVLKAFGGGQGNYAGVAGGSGSGGGYGGYTGGASNQTSNNGGTGYGNAGGNSTNVNFASAGGGGAGGAGGANASTVGGAGGAGLNTWSSWASATNTGVSGYFAGGGGGGGSGGAGTGGSGGGGAGAGRATGVAAGSGVANTGGGGGSAAGGNPVGTGGAGGSGIVIVRYTIA